jgi:hypothetical protein
MLRSGKSVRLTAPEKSQFDLLAVDSTKAPVTVRELNARMDLARQTWSEAGTAEGDLLASLAVDLKAERI